MAKNKVAPAKDRFKKDLKHTFKVPLSDIGSKIITIKPVEVTITLDWEADSDADNIVLHAEIDELWKGYVKLAQNFFTKDVKNCVGRLAIALARFDKSGKKAVAERADLAKLQSIIDKHNQIIFTRFTAWQNSFGEAVDKRMVDWSKINQAAALVRAKQMGRIAKDCLGIAKNVVTPMDLSGVGGILSGLKNLVDHVRDAVGDVESKHKKVEEEFDKLTRHIDALDKKNWKATLLRCKDQISSCTANIMKAKQSYGEAVTLMKSQEKRLGTALRKLEKEAEKEGADEKMMAALGELQDLHKDVELHANKVAVVNVWVGRVVIEKELKTLTEATKDSVKSAMVKKFKKIINKDQKVMFDDVTRLKKVNLRDAEGEIATLQNQLKMSKRKVVIAF